MTEPTTEAIARNAALTLVARGVQLIGIPCALWLLYSAGTALDTLKTDVAGLKATMTARIETAALREKVQDERIGAVEQRAWPPPMPPMPSRR